MANLRAKRDAKLDTFGIERIVPPIVWGQSPKPGQEAQTFEPVIFYAPPQFSHCVHGTSDVDARYANDSVWILSNDISHTFIRDHGPPGTPPCIGHHLGEVAILHRCQ